MYMLLELTYPPNSKFDHVYQYVLFQREMLFFVHREISDHKVTKFKFMIQAI